MTISQIPWSCIVIGDIFRFFAKFSPPPPPPPPPPIIKGLFYIENKPFLDKILYFLNLGLNSSKL